MKSGSHKTRRWREGDSNPQSLSRRSRSRGTGSERRVVVSKSVVPLSGTDGSNPASSTGSRLLRAFDDAEVAPGDHLTRRLADGSTERIASMKEASSAVTGAPNSFAGAPFSQMRP